MSTAVHRSPNKLWRSNSIFNLWWPKRNKNKRISILKGLNQHDICLAGSIQPCSIRCVFWSVVDPDPQSSAFDLDRLDPNPFRILTGKNYQKNFMFRRAEGFSCSLDVLHVGVGKKNKLTIFDQLNRNFNNVLSSKTLEPIRNWIRNSVNLKWWIRIRTETKADPQHWFFSQAWRNLQFKVFFSLLMAEAFSCSLFIKV